MTRISAEVSTSSEPPEPDASPKSAVSTSVTGRSNRTKQRSISGDTERLAALLQESNGVILTRECEEDDKRRLLRWCRWGLLKRVMRGLYVAPEPRVELLVRAVARMYPDAIFVGETAAWLNGQIKRVPKIITAAHVGRSRTFAGIRMIRSRVPDDLWVERHGLRRMTGSAAAVEVVPQRGAELIDDLMRFSRDNRRLLAHLGAVLRSRPWRSGNVQRRVVVERTSTFPWSAAERVLHELLDEAGIKGWSANTEMMIDGQMIVPDVTFKRSRLILEADGYAFHADRSSFQRDRARQNQLVLEGWRILRFTWEDLTERPDEVVRQVLSALT